MKFDVLKQCKLTILILLLREKIMESWETAAVLRTVLPNFSIGMHSDNYELIWYDDKQLGTLHFDSSLSDLDLDLASKSQECEKANIFVSIISQSFELILIEFVMLLRLCLMKLMLIVSCSMKVQGRKLYIYDS